MYLVFNSNIINNKLQRSVIFIVNMFARQESSVGTIYYSPHLLKDVTPLGFVILYTEKFYKYCIPLGFEIINNLGMIL